MTIRRRDVSILADALDATEHLDEMDFAVSRPSEARASALLEALEAHGREVTDTMGRATWVWQEPVEIHTPVCARCGGWLPEARVDIGSCEGCS